MNKYEEALWFYCRNDYIIINDLLWGNWDKLEKGMQIVVDDAKGVMKEADEIGIENRWQGTPEECQKIYNAYKKRTPKALDELGKKQLIKQANDDIDNLCKILKPCKEDITLYRNVRALDFREHFVGDKITMKGFSSCSKNKVEESFGGGPKFFRLNLVVPKGTLCIDTALFSQYANEQDEVILPPFECIVKSVKSSKNQNCLCEVDVVLSKTLKPQIPKNSYEKIEK